MRLTPFAAIALLSREAATLAPPRQNSEMMRFSCSQLAIERIDPLVSPGLTPSPHLHQIGGGNSFNASMPAGEFDPVTRSTCTTCTFAEDFSNYWTANLYFRARNGSFKRVPQLANTGLKADGGITVYYIPPYDGKSRVTAPKPVSLSMFYYVLRSNIIRRVSACSSVTQVYGQAKLSNANSAIVASAQLNNAHLEEHLAQVTTPLHFLPGFVRAEFVLQSHSPRKQIVCAQFEANTNN